MGETQQAFATRDVEPSIPNKDRRFRPFGKRDVSDFDGSFLEGSESRGLRPGTEKGPSVAGTKGKETHSQREAVIRPQQVGKIDFKSLHNRPKFLREGPWGAVQGSPQSPTGKSRAREKSRRPGKGERAGHQQLYRLTPTSARPSPTIGIAYPQQKVAPPKKAEATQQGGAIPVSYGPQAPEREAERPQEEPGFARCYPEASPSPLPGNYTSSTGPPRLNPAGKLPPPLGGVPHQTPVPNGPLYYLGNHGSLAWPSPEKSFPGATSSSSSSSSSSSGHLAPTKPCPFPESSKAGPLGPGPLSFHCPFQPSDPFPGDDSAGDYTDLSAATGPGSHGAFAFPSSARDWKGDPLALGACSSLGLESRACGLPPAFLPPQSQGPLPGYKGRKEAPSDHHGALSPHGAMDKNSSTFQDNPDLFPSGFQGSSKRPPSLQDSVASPRVLDAGHALRRMLPHPPLPQAHFQNKACLDPSAGGGSPGPFGKSHPSAAQAHARPLPAWEGGRKAHTPVEEGATAYLSPLGSQLSSGCPSGQEPWQPVETPWPPPHLPASGLPGQGRLGLPRKLPLSLGTSEWGGSGQVQKSPAGYGGSRAPLTREGAILQRQEEPGPNAFCVDRAKDAGGPRGKAFFFGMSQGALSASAHLPPLSPLALPPSTLATSPSDSPASSPALNGGSSSTCSSLSSTSSASPCGFEEGAAPHAPAAFHLLRHPKSGYNPFHPPESLGAGEGPGLVADPAKALLLYQGAAHKQEPFCKSRPVGGHVPKPCLGASFKGCVQGSEAEPLPPPPYSSHHFLASSLSSASLDQLDVLLTCKQCDQNFSTLPSFLEHRQFCSSHLGPQSHPREAPHGTESRTQPPAPPTPEKPTPGPQGLLLLPLEPPLPLPALSKASDFLADEDSKGESKVAAHPLPLTASDLDIDDAKLDSLITEALNGLGYQSDSPEIDSSFIDVFADEELASVKVVGSGMPCKPKEDLPSGAWEKQVDTEENVKELSCYNGHPCQDPAKGRVPGQHHGPQERRTGWSPCHGEDSHETLRRTELPPCERVAPEMYSGGCPKGGWRDGSSPPLPRKLGARATPATKQPKSSPCLPVSKLGAPSRSASRKANVKGATKQQRRSGTWSKELIHKIVQQKNKLHKAVTQGSKATPFSSLAGGRLVPKMKDSPFGEYDYISESDEERVEYAKRHCRRKLGARLSGRLRGSFGRRRPGRAGREKEEEEKEPAWRFGPRRVLREEPRRMEERLASRAWRRSSQSSSSSCHSTSLSSEGSHSSPGTERADSDTEKESEGGRGRLLPSISPPEQPLARARQLARPEKEGAKTQPVGSAAPPRERPSASPLLHPSREGACLHPEEEEPRHSRGSLGHGPRAPFGPKEPDGFSESSSRPQGCQAGGTAALEADPSHPHQFPAYQGGEASEGRQEELLSASPRGLPGEGDTSCRQGQASKGWREPTECLAPGGCFNGSPPVDAGVVGKGLATPTEAARMFSDCKGLPGHCEPSGLFSAPTEPAHPARFYLSPRDLGAGLLLKESPHPSGPYGAESQPPTTPAPLGFDPSSVFGELPAAGFCTAMYEEVDTSREGYVSFEGPGHQLEKMGVLDQPYPSFLHDKAWPLVEEGGAAALPEGLSSFHSLAEEKPGPKRYPGALSPAADYSLPFLSAASEDELEIKRLVTELENQLQAGKLHLEEEEEEEEEAPRGPSAAPTPPAGRTEPPREFLPSTLGQESPGKGLFLAEADLEAEDLLAASAYPCGRLDPEKTASGPTYGRHRDTWPCSAPFDPPFKEALPPPSPSELLLAAPLSSKGDPGELYESLKDAELSGEAGFPGTRGDDPAGMVADPCLPDSSYPEDWGPGPGPLLLPTLGAAGLPAHRASPATPSLELPTKEEMAGSAAGLGLLHHPFPSLRVTFGQGDATAAAAAAAAAAAQEGPGGNPAPGGPSPAGPEEEEQEQEEQEAFPEISPPERLASATPLHGGPDAQGKERQALSQTQAAPGKAGERSAVPPLEPLPYSEEGHREASPWSAPEGKAPSPLQQLQLFVARTAKHNEEDLLLPCFSVGLPGPHLHPGQEKEPAGTMPGKEAASNPGVEARRAPGTAEEPKGTSQDSDPTEGLWEPAEQGQRPGGRPHACPKAPAMLPPSPERNDAVADGWRGQQMHRREDCPEEGEESHPSDGFAPERSHSVATSSSSSSSSSAWPREGEEAPAGQLMGEPEEGKAALVFQREVESAWSQGSQEKGTPGGVRADSLKAPAPRQAAWGHTCPKGRGLWTEEGPQAERKGPPRGKRQPSPCLAPAPPPLGVRSLPQGRALCLGAGPVSAEGNSPPRKTQASSPEEASPGPLPQKVGLAGQEGSQDEGPGRLARSDVGLPPAEEEEEEEGGLAAAEGRQGPLLVCGHPPGALKGATGKATPTPSEPPERDRRQPPSPFGQHTRPPSPLLPSEAPANGQECLAKERDQNLAGPQGKVPVLCAAALCSGDRAAPLAGTGPPTEPQAGSGASPGATLSFGNKDLPALEELPKRLGDEDSGLCGARGRVSSCPPSASRQNTPHGPSPSEADSAVLAEERVAANAAFPPKNLAGKEDKCCSHPPTQTEVPSVEVPVPGTPKATLTETGDAGGAQPEPEDDFPEVAEKGLGGALQGLGCGGPAAEEAEAERKASSQGLPRSSLQRLEGRKGERPREAAMARPPRAKRRKGPPSACDVCCVLFKSKLGLMRHKAVKHLKANVGSLFLDRDLASPEEPSEPSKALPRKTRMPSVDEEEANCSHLAKAATSQPFPKPYRGPRREPNREMQEVVSKVLRDLSVISSAISHKLKRRDGPHQERRAKLPSSWADGAEEEEASCSPVEAKAGGGGGGGASSTKESESFAGRKPKGKARKGKGKVAAGPQEAPRHPSETPLPSTHPDVTHNSLDPVVTTGLEGEEAGPTCSTEDLARDWTPPWPFGPLALNGSEAAPGRRPSTDRTPEPPGPLWDARGGQGQAGELVGKGPWSTPDRWPRASTEATEEGGKSGACEEQEDDPMVEGSPGERRPAWAPDHLLGSPLGESLPESSASGKAMEPTRPPPVEAEPQRMEERPPEMEPHRGSSVAANLHSLFDDDPSFSQLFPRKDHFDARRKCAHVYGKRPKKLRPVAEAKARLEGPTDPLGVRMASDLGDTGSLGVTREDPFEYDTLSTDDTLLLHMSHGGGGHAGATEVGSRSAERTAWPPEAEPREGSTEAKEERQVPFLEPKSPAGSLQGFRGQSSPERKAGGVSSLGKERLSPPQAFPAGPLSAEATEAPELEGGALESLAEQNLPSPAFDTSGTEMLAVTIDTRDLCPCGVGEDPLSQAGDDGSREPPALPGRATKSKLEEGKAGKARGDLTLKGKEKPYKCKVCFQWFLTLGELDFHKLSHNPSPPPTCYMCVQRRFSSREQLRDHLREKHARNKAGLWACGMCLKEVPGVWMYNEHLREHATQFARRGQAQASALGLPGSCCFGQDEAAVSRFLCSLLRQRPSRAPRQPGPGGRAPTTGQESPGQKGPPGPGGGLSRESPEAPPGTQPPAASPQTASSSPEPAPKADGAPKLAQAMHPECKDPSRDCHHCGKQFPKPFKLQRHLVVHSFQKIYLCPLCPTFYPETQELRHHLGQEHRAAEAMELKHTTLYACELCADVMHVIKKSFICSACNYTFSKKEQYDRHMEKHLVGGSQTFRFRGVMRPGAAPGKEAGKKTKEEAPPGEGSMPVAKRKKVAHSLAGSDGNQEAPLEGEPPAPLGRPPAAPRRPTAPSQDPVKTEELEGGFCSLLSEMPESPPGSLPPPMPLVSPEGGSRAPGLGRVYVGQPSEGHLLGENLPPSLDPPGAGVGVDLAHSTSTKTASPASVAPKGPPAHPPEKHSKEPSAPGEKPLSSSNSSSNVAPVLEPWVSLGFEEGPPSKTLGLPGASAGATECETQGITRPPPPEEAQLPERAAKLPCPDAAFQVLPLKDKAPLPALPRPAREVPPKKSTRALAEVAHSGAAQDLPASCGPDVGAQEAGSLPLQPIGGSSRGEAGRGPARANTAEPGRCPERPVASLVAKPHPPKRKERKASPKGRPASRENLEEEGRGGCGRKKVPRRQEPGRNENARRPPRTGWASGEGLALSPRRRDSPCPKLTPKLKLPVPGVPLWKLGPDPCLQKKEEGRPPANGDWKPRRKDLRGGKAVHPLVAKDPALPSSSNRPRAAQGAKLTDAAHNYRTAESQNNLLSQLFGQKLTSFKIPLRRDTSE